MSQQFPLPKNFLIGSGLGVGVKYTAPQSTDKFRFILMKDPNNYAIQVAVYYESKQLIVNSKEDANWGEGIDFSDQFDFSSGIAVAIRVEAREQHYDVFFNDKHLGKFDHRLPLKDVDAAVVYSDIKVETYSLHYK